MGKKINNNTLSAKIRQNKSMTPRVPKFAKNRSKNVAETSRNVSRKRRGNVAETSRNAETSRQRHSGERGVFLEFFLLCRSRPDLDQNAQGVVHNT